MHFYASAFRPVSAFSAEVRSHSYSIKRFSASAISASRGSALRLGASSLQTNARPLEPRSGAPGVAWRDSIKPSRAVIRFHQRRIEDRRGSLPRRRFCPSRRRHLSPIPRGRSPGFSRNEFAIGWRRARNRVHQLARLRGAECLGGAASFAAIGV